MKLLYFYAISMHAVSGSLSVTIVRGLYAGIACMQGCLVSMDGHPSASAIFSVLQCVAKVSVT